jgi:hypothetical protein
LKEFLESTQSDPQCGRSAILRQEASNHSFAE